MQRRKFIGTQLAAAASAVLLGGALTGRASAQSSGLPGISRPDGGPLRVGLIELDTSHANSFARGIGATSGVELTAIINSGLVTGKKHTEKFAAEHKVKTVCSSPAEMVPLVDVAFSIGVNWDNHVSDAEPFIVAGKPVFIDKPVVGSEHAARRLIELSARYNTPIFGGSTYCWAPNLPAFKKELQAREDGVNLTVYGKINSHGRYDMLDLIYYGIHGAELASYLMGPGALSVNYVDFYRKQHIIHVRYDDRPPVILNLGWARNHNEAVLLTDKELISFVPEGGNPYPEIFAAMARSITTRRALRPITEQVEACRILIAAGKSRQLGRPVFLSELTEADGYSGRQFGHEYARFRSLPREATRDWRENEL
jgi:GFO/IDH/MocA oxidoreductase family protein